MPDISSHTKEMVTELENMAKNLQDVQKNGACFGTQIGVPIAGCRFKRWSQSLRT
jgi:hypothetical protein